MRRLRISWCARTPAGDTTGLWEHWPIWVSCHSPKLHPGPCHHVATRSVTVMKIAELRDCDDPADTRDRPKEWTLLVEPPMGPGPMVVTEIRSQGSLQMSRVQDDEVVQAVSSYRADQAFDVGVLPGTPRRG